MSDPAWGQTGIYEDGANFTFPNFQTFDHVAGNISQITAPAILGSAAVYFEIHCVAGGGQGCVGFIQTNYTGANSSVNFTLPGFVANFDNGDIVANGTITTTGFAGAITTGTVTRYYLDGAGNYAVATGAADWNGSFTDAQIAAGTGLQPLTGLTAPFQPFVSLNEGSGTQSFAIFASSANCSFPLISGAAYLPANTILTLSGVTAVVGSPLLGTWTAANADPGAALEVSVNGGSPVATGGTNTGTGGVFTGPTVGSVGWLSAGILDPSNTLSALPASYYYGEPVNSGPVAASGTGTLGNLPGLSSTATLTFAGLTDYVIFNATIQAIQQLDGFIIEFLGNDGTTPCCTIDFGNNGSPTSPTNPIIVNAPEGAVPSIVATLASSTVTVTGTLVLTTDIGGDSTVAYNVSCSGSNVIGSTGVGTIAGISSIYVLSENISLEQNEVRYLVHAEGAPLAETLVLSTVSYNGGTEILSVGGSVNSTLTALGISTDGTLSTDGSLTVTGSLYSATLAGSLAAGTHTVQTVDVTTSVESNTLTLVVAPAETLTLTDALYNTSTDILSVSGAVTNAALTSLGISTGGTFAPATSLTVSGGFYVATLAGSLSAGSYTIQTEDLTTSIVSNTEPLVVAGEALGLSTANYNTATEILTIGGTIENATLTSLGISTGGTFTPATSLTIAGTAYSATLAGHLSAGAYTLQSEDLATSVQSNTLSLDVSGETLTLLSVGLDGSSTLQLSGTVTGATLTELSISVAGTIAAASSLSVTGTAWSATGGVLSVGEYPILVIDDTTDVESNTLSLVVSSESLTLTSLTGGIGDALDFAGTSLGGTSSAVLLSINGGAFSATGTFSGGSPFTGSSAGTITTSGVYAAQICDATNTYIKSNVISAAIGITETITLTKAGGSVGQHLSLAGYTNGGPATALQFTLDGGITWSAVTSYVADAGTLNAPWTALGSVLAANTYRIAVRDTAFPSVVSNYIDLTLTAETITLLTASVQVASTNGSQTNILNRLRALLPSSWFPNGLATAAGANTLVLGGTSSGGPPPGLQVTINGRATWLQTSGYATAGGAINAHWTAFGPTLLAGPYNVAVRDTSNHSVVSNLLGLTVAAPVSGNSIATILNTILTGPAYALAWAYGLVTWLIAQTRLGSSVGGMIDLWAYDFFGPALLRKAGQKDANFIFAIQNNLLKPLVTRAAMKDALFRLTGRVPTIFEPFNTEDTGGYNTGVLAYNTAGAYGSLLLPAQAFVTAFRPNNTSGQTLGNVAGYGISVGGYGVGAIEWISGADAADTVEDQEILATINRTKAAGVVIWTQILD